MYESWIHWNPPRFLFTIPIIERPIAFYGICFALGFAASYHFFLRILRTYLQEGPLSEMNIEKPKELLAELKGQVEWYKLLPGPLTSKLKEGRKDLKKNLVYALEHLRKEKLSEEVTSLKALEERLPHLVSTNDVAHYLGDKALWFSVIGTAVGARLAHVFFYSWPYYQNNLMEIPLFWDGGLASHGGIIGVILGWLVFYKLLKKHYSWFSVWSVLDTGAVCIGLALGGIRIGNFFNQEIVGKESSLPWAIVFERPAEAVSSVPRHPVQLYESLSYISLFIVFYLLWKSRRHLFRPGVFFGAVNAVFFTARFFMEFFKEKQSEFITDGASLLMGQYLSIPFIIMGITIAVLRQKNRQVSNH